MDDDTQPSKEIILEDRSKRLLATESFKPGWYFEIPSDVYHADKGAVNSSSLKLFKKSAASFYSGFFGDVKKEPTPAMNLGTLFHAAVLEPQKFRERYIRQPKFGDLRTTANKIKKEEWFSLVPPDSIVVTEEEHIQIDGMLNSVFKHNDACRLLKQQGAYSEVSGYYVDPLTGIKCRIRPDFIDTSLMALVDVKTTRNCEVREFSKSCAVFGYHLQMAMYCEGIAQITGKQVKYPVFLAVEKDPPYEIAVYLADEAMLMKGSADYHLALTNLKMCIENNEWHPYQRGVQQLTLPDWALKE